MWALFDLRQLLLKLSDRLTHMSKILLNGAPHYIAYCNESAFGAGGVRCSGADPLPKTVCNGRKI